MRLSLSPWLATTIACGFYWLAMSSARPVVGLYARSLGADTFTIGLLLGTQALFPLVAGIPAGSLADRIGRRRVLQASSLLMVAGGLLYLVSVDLPTLLVAQITGGVAQLGVWLCVQALITEQKKGTSTAAAVAWFTVAQSTGTLLGPALGGVAADTVGFKGAFALYTLFSVLIALATRFVPPDAPAVAAVAAPRPPLLVDVGSSYRRSGELLRERGLRAALLLTFIMLFIADARGTFFILFLSEQGLTPSAIGVLLSCGAVASMVVRPLGANLIERAPRGLLVGTTLALAILPLMLIPTVRHPVAWGVGVMIGAAAQGLNLPLSMLLIAESTPRERRGLAMGLRLSANRAAQLIDPLLFGAVATVAGLAGAFYVVGALLAGGAVLLTSWFVALDRTAQAETVRAETAPEGVAKNLTTPITAS